MKKAVRIIAVCCGGVVALSLVLFITLFFATKGTYEVPLTVEFDPSLPSVTVDSVTFHAETFGDSSKPLLIVLHGGPGNDYRYLYPMKALQDEYFVLMYDQRGTGLSPRVSQEQHTLDTSLADLKRLMDHFSPDRPVSLLGHSWGAMLASSITAKYPSRIARVILAEPGILTPEAGEVYMNKLKFKPSWKLVKSLTLTLFKSFHIKERDGQEREDYFLTELSHLDIPGNPMNDYYCDKSVSAPQAHCWRYSLNASRYILASGRENGKFTMDLVEGIESYNDTILLISSSCNSLIGKEYQQEYHEKLFPKVRHETIEEAGHTMLGERPEESLKIIREFLAGYTPEKTAR